MWKMGDGIFPAGFTGSGISELHFLAERRAKPTLLLPVSTTLNGTCSMGDGNELAAVGIGRAGETRKTMRGDIV